jgi:cold shock CspA family protein/tetratricopeptide (TPR) repeat protein
MAYSVVRLTLYALITALESDLRHIIATHLLSHKKPKEILPPVVYEKVHDRLERENGLASGYDENRIIEFLDFAEAIETISANKADLGATIEKAGKLLGQSASTLVPIRNRVMHSRPLEFYDFPTVTNICNTLAGYPSSLFQTLQLETQKIKTDPTYVLSLNLTDLDRGLAEHRHNLPIPDFDETGFLGRTAESKDLLHVCKGNNWPVVTIKGDGGVGKTALALKVAYDLLDDADAGFDAVVWTTAKTTRLTVSDIERIDGAIKDSIGILSDLSSSLLNDNSTSIDEILEYLNCLKILLIMDNLETVIDDIIRNFLRGIRSKSKVLITSRVGLGELEYPFPLTAMTDDECVSLLRAIAQVRRVPQITKTNNSILKGYCKKMKNNSLFIKWFVSVVQAGKRPEEALADQTMFLDYCVSNVVEYLSEDAGVVAGAMLAVPGTHSQPFLAYLTGLDGDRLHIALQQLITTNVAVMSPTPTPTGYETLYELGDLPRGYLLKSHPPSKADIAAFGRRRTELARAREQIKAQASVSAYNANAVAIRGRDDVVVAKYLMDALQAVRQRRQDDAIRSVENAKKLAPTYAEVYRVEAWAQYFLGNYAAAREAYEMAVELDPQSAPLRFWYGGFLLRANEDPEGAAEQLRVARTLDPEAPEVRLEYARILSYLFKFDDADVELHPVIESGAFATKIMRVAYDGWLQIAARRANFRINNNDYLGALDALEETARRFRTVPGDFLDEKIINTVTQCVPNTQRMMSQLRYSDASARAEQLVALFEEFRAERPAAGEQSAREFREGADHTGEIKTINGTGKYGFIKVDGGGILFFHQSQLIAPANIMQLSCGQRVGFTIGRNNQGVTADKVRLLEHSRDRSPNLDVMSGVFLRVGEPPTFGFIQPDDRDHGQELFFHRSELNGLDITRLEPGAPMKFRVRQSEKGCIATSVELSRRCLLDDAIASKLRVSGEVVAREAATATGVVLVEHAGEVRISSRDLREPKLWNIVGIGDKVLFSVERRGRNFIGRDIEYVGDKAAPEN